MKDKISISIKKPCSADWHEMSVAKQGKFCLNCRKEVIDFTQLSDNQITEFFILNKGKICGRFYPNQLKLYTPVSSKQSYLPLLTLLGLSFIVTPIKAQDTDENKVLHIQPINSCIIANQGQIDKTIPASEFTITGFIYDKHTSEPLHGVSVYLKGTAKGAVSDSTGKFEVKLTEQPDTTVTLVFAFIGYERVTKEIEFNENRSLDLGNITMNVDITGLLGEVVVVNYNPVKGVWWKIKNLFIR